MALKIREECVKVVSVFDLEKAAVEKYGQEPEIVVSEEWSNDSAHKFEIVGRDRWTKLDTEDFNKFKDNGYASYGICRQILEDLVADGDLEPGTYLVEIYW